MTLPRFSPRPVRLVHRECIATGVADADFLKHAELCASEPGSVILLSGGTPPREGESRYSIAAGNPLMVLETKGSSCTLKTEGESITIQSNPLDVLDEVLDSLKPDFPLAVRPFSGGAAGYFAYDLKDRIERLPQTARDDLDLPDIYLIWPGQLLIHDRGEGNLYNVVLGLDGECPRGGNPQGWFFGSTTSAGEEGRAELPLRVGELRSNFTHEAYLDAVRKVRHYIREGDVYQVNLSQRFQFTFEGNAFRLWRSLFDLNPAAFYAFVNAGDHQVLSTSMERFLYRKDSRIEARPIKGTRKRGKTPEEDERLKADLATSPKDDAELSMIVDLLRNDLGRVCSPRTVRVEEHKRLESYQNVHHLVSTVAGELRPGTTCGEVFRATFPGGSITGCPKIRSMEVIDELEPDVRHIYTGSIGYIGWHDNFDLNIAIRTAIIREGTCYFSVGGGIVYDSDEEDEYQETLHKGGTLFQVIERLGKGTP